MNILFVCSANEERSITAEHLFRDVPGWDTKSAGTNINAVRRITPKLINWADKIISMEPNHYQELIKMTPEASPKITILNIEDRFYRGSPELVGRLIIEMSKRFQLDTWIKSKFQL